MNLVYKRLTSLTLGRASYSNARHPYGFPRIVGMLGDGKTAYDQDTDGDTNSIGSCQVRIPHLSSSRCLNGRTGDDPAHERHHQAQADLRQRRLPRRKSHLHRPPARRLTRRQVKVHYRACTYARSPIAAR